ncbi:Cu2+-exporting ATPase [Breznakia blatticola]|uniref:P-type Cu(+) transporter n=1 Tax=Breznakia blatticola TaxID=1754012 RepID=A0A4R7ZPG9_9FIRM|nr:copper-translocating P-type ATPase [Breznakia blatticola]TDW19803.1 Cu2+-exporting ATPase [Breznakia blatticola]
MAHMMHMKNLKQKFFISLILAIPIFLLSNMMGLQLPIHIQFTGSHWLVLLCSTVLFFYGGSPFLSGAKMEIQMRQPAMMSLIALGISTAYIYSLYAFVVNYILHLQPHVMDFFWELASLIVIMLFGHWMEMKSVMQAGDALESMAKLLPSVASVKQSDGSYLDTPIEQLKKDDIVLVKAGERIPADGVLIDGSGSVDESLVTGESRAITKQINDTLIGGSQNGNHSLTMKIHATGDASYISQVMKLVSDAQKEKSKVESISDVVAKYLFYIATGVGIASFIIWLILSKDVSTALLRMVSVLVIACPHALGLAIPLVVARSTSIGAKHGILIRKRTALEIANKITIVMSDKTGTLTEGKFKVKEIQSVSTKYDDNQILAYMAGLESESSHPLAFGILNDAKAKQIKPVSLSNIETLPGIGLQGILDQNTKLLLVSHSYMDTHQINYDKTTFDMLSEKGYAISYLLENEQLIGYIAQGDEIKEDAKTFIQGLKEKGITSMMLTGDNEKAASKVQQLLHIDKVESSLQPQDKEHIIQTYQAHGEKVMMVGDGINDAPALSRANIGVAIGAGTDVAIDSADVVLVKSNPLDILNFFSLAKNTTRKMMQNLWLGAGYNIIAIPLAAGVLAPFGIILSPAIGAILMSASTIIVAINAMMLKL